MTEALGVKEKRPTQSRDRPFLLLAGRWQKSSTETGCLQERFNRRWTMIIRAYYPLNICGLKNSLSYRTKSTC